MERRAFLFCGVSACAVPAWGAEPLLSRPQILASLKEQVDTAQAAPGMVAGVLDARGRRLVSHGKSAAGNGALDGDTLFGLASLTKVFTALLLAEMAARGEVALDDAIGKYLPAEVRVPDFGGRAVTLIDIATYAPGLPGWPPNMKGLDPAKPFPDYPVADLYAALNGGKLKYAPGTHYEYSNFGYGLLAHALARHAGASFEELLVSRLCAPLGMDSTRITLTPALRARLAGAHGDKGKPVSAWEFPPTLAGAGALYSSANDMLRFLEAATGRRKTKLAPAFATLLKLRRPANEAGTEAAAGWFVSTRKGDELVWKDGATVGYSSFLGYEPQSRTGLVLLANGQCGGTLTPLGKHLLNADFPLSQ